MTDREGSAVPPSTPPARATTGSFPGVRVLTLVDLQALVPDLAAQVERLSAIVRGDMRPAVRELQRLVGDEGSEIHKRDPTGLHAAFSRMSNSLDQLVGLAQAAEKRQAAIVGPARGLAYDAARALVLAAVGALLLYLGGFHR